MRYTKYTKQNTTQKTKDWDTQSTLNKILHRKLTDWETQSTLSKTLHRKLTIEIHKVH